MRPIHIALLAGAGILIGATLAGLTNMVASKQPATAAAPITTASIGGPFTLTRTDGQTFTQDDLKGRPTALFFGFTMCPDVCPTTLYELTDLMQKLGDQADGLNVVFVSVDWERDGPEQVARYVDSFDSRFIGLSGTEQQIADIAKAYKIYVERVPIDGGYTIDHTASVLLLDSEGRFSGTLAYDESQDTKLEKLKRLTAAQ